MGDFKTLVKENKENVTLFGTVAAALLVIIIGVLVWEMPVVPVCILVLLEAGLSICLQDVPIWLHGIVVIAQIVLGAIFGKILFLLLCAVFYVAGILALSVWDK